MKINILITLIISGLLASHLSIAYPNKLTSSALSWWSDNQNDVMSAAPPPEHQAQWYLRIKVNDKCGNDPCGDIRIINCLMLSTLSAGQEGLCQFADSKKSVTWSSGTKSAGELEYIQ